MKRKLPTALCAAIAVVLVIFGMCYGTWSGFREDRAKVDELLTMENGLLDVLWYRAADGLNLSAVAKRHLPAQDEALTALEKSARELQLTEDIRTASLLDHSVSEGFHAVSAKLQETDSFLQSERDRRYLEMLTADLNSLQASEIVYTYNQAASGFNSQLAQPVSGWLAGVMGIERCQLYE